MDEQELIKLMDELDDAEVHLGNVFSDRETLKKKQIPLEIQAELESIDFEFADQIKALEDNAKERKETLQKLLREYGKPIKSTFYSFTYKEGEPEWDTSFLDGYSLNHPEILHWRHEGKPITRLTKIKK